MNYHDHPAFFFPLFWKLKKKKSIRADTHWFGNLCLCFLRNLSSSNFIGAVAKVNYLDTGDSPLCWQVIFIFTDKLLSRGDETV